MPKLHPALQPRVLPLHVLAAVLVAVAIGFALWQQDSWQQQRTLDAVDQTLSEPVPLDDALQPGQPFPGDAVGRPVVVEGTWQPESTFFVTDRRRDGEWGYWVVTPVEPGGAAGDAQLAVVRGWTPSLDDVPPAPSGTVETVAWLQPGEGTGVDDDDPSDRLLPQMRMADVLLLLDAETYGGYAVVADRVAEGGAWPVGDDAVNAGTDGLQSVAPEHMPDPSGGSGLRNLLYAIEWWVFAAFAVFVWWRFTRDEVLKARGIDPRGRRHRGGPDDQDGGDADGSGGGSDGGADGGGPGPRRPLVEAGTSET